MIRFVFAGRRIELAHDPDEPGADAMRWCPEDDTDSEDWGRAALTTRTWHATAASHLE